MFRVNDLVKSHSIGTGVVVSTTEQGEYCVKVNFKGQIKSYTKEGRRISKQPSSQNDIFLTFRNPLER